MSVSASKTVTINAPLDQVLATIRDVAGQTEWWPGTISAVVDSTDEAGLPARATLVNDVKVAKDEFQLDYEHSDTGMSWSLVAPSKAQKAQKGSWVLVDKGGSTEATVSLDVDSSLPLPGFVQKKVVGDTLKGATEGLRKHLGG
jgi:Polyketide cyclase / dehydrase and lipid transport